MRPGNLVGVGAGVDEELNSWLDLDEEPRFSVLGNTQSRSLQLARRCYGCHDMHRPSFLVLTALAGAGPLHGYGLVQAIESMTDGTESPSLGGVYGVLDRLEGEGQVRVHAETVESGRTRRYYAITDSGRQALSDEADRMEADARLGRRMLQAETDGGR